jgi:hypothetical protein
VASLLRLEAFTARCHRPAGFNDTSGVVGTADPPYLPADSTDRRPVRGLPLRNRPRPSCAQRPCNALAHGGRSGMRESLGRSPPWCLARCVSAALSLKRLPLIPPQHGEACSPFAGIRSTKMRPRIDCAPMPPAPLPRRDARAVRQGPLGWDVREGHEGRLAGPLCVCSPPLGRQLEPGRLGSLVQTNRPLRTTTDLACTSTGPSGIAGPAIDGSNGWLDPVSTRSRHVRGTGTANSSGVE